MTDDGRQETPRRPRPRRATVAPTRLKQVARLEHELPSTAAASPRVEHDSAQADTAQTSMAQANSAQANPAQANRAQTRPARPGAGSTPSVLDELAKEDRDEGWGGKPTAEDKDAWLRSERPPHWGSD